MSNLETLSEKDQFLIKNAEIGYRSAKELLAQWKAKEQSGELKKFALNPSTAGGLHLDCFYGDLVLSGRQTSAMGCHWKSRFQRKAASVSQGPATDVTLHSFIQKQFLRLAHWTHPDGLPAGFEFKTLQYKLKDREEYGVFPPEEPLSDISEIGKKYDWVVMESIVHDFFRNVPGPRMGPRMLSKMPKMASYVLVHQDYFSSFHAPVEGVAAECCFGYSFLPCPVRKGIFGYGPGEFKAAVKQFRFLLLNSGDIEIQMFFLVSPRSEKILSVSTDKRQHKRFPVKGHASVLLPSEEFSAEVLDIGAGGIRILNTVAVPIGTEIELRFTIEGYNTEIQAKGRVASCGGGVIGIQFPREPEGLNDLLLSLEGFDPVYSSVRLLDSLTLNLFNFKNRAHDKMDAFQLLVHAKVYQSLLDGLKDVWENQDWISALR